MAQISSTKCNICEKELGELFCYECQHFLCTSCKLFHEKFPATKTHSVTESHNIDRTTLSSQQLCNEHKLDFVHYCSTCKLLTCSACVTSKHNGHSFTEVAKVAAEARTVATENLNILKEKLKNLSDLIDRTKSKEIDLIKKESDTFISNVNTISDDFIGIVNSVTEINITRASDYYVTEKQALEYSVAKLEKTYSEYQTLCTKLEQLLLQKNHVSFFNIHESLTKELKELDDIPSIEGPLFIEKFKDEDYTDLVIEKIQNKYEIRSFNLQQKEIQQLKQAQEKLISLQRTKEKELLELRREIEQYKTERKQKTELPGKTTYDEDSTISSIAEKNEININTDDSDEISPSFCNNEELQCQSGERTETEYKTTEPIKVIHLGDSQSGIILAYPNANSGNIDLKYHARKFTLWDEEPLQSTAVILNKYNNVEWFGDQALQYTDRYDEWYFFKNFLWKINLTENTEVEQMVTTADGGKQLPALMLCSIIIRFLLDKVPEIVDCLHVLTIPDRWNNLGKEFIMQVAKRAGIDEKQLVIVAESEAAFANVKYKLVRGDLGRWDSFKPGSSSSVYLNGQTVNAIT